MRFTDCDYLPLVVTVHSRQTRQQQQACFMLACLRACLPVRLAARLLVLVRLRVWRLRWLGKMKKADNFFWKQAGKPGGGGARSERTLLPLHSPCEKIFLHFLKPAGECRGEAYE